MARARRKKPPVVHEFEEPERTAEEREEGRYRVYVFLPGEETLGLKVPGGSLVVLASTPGGLESCLTLLREEGQITNDSIVGIKDDVERKWLVNPLAKGDKK